MYFNYELQPFLSEPLLLDTSAGSGSRVFGSGTLQQFQNKFPVQKFYILSARSMRALIHLAFYSSSSCLVGPFPQFCAFHYKYLSLSVCKCQVVSLTCL